MTFNPCWARLAHHEPGDYVLTVPFMEANRTPVQGLFDFKTAYSPLQALVEATYRPTLNAWGQDYEIGRYVGNGTKDRDLLRYNPLEATSDWPDAFCRRVERIGGQIDLILDSDVRWKVEKSELVSLCGGEDRFDGEWSDLMKFLGIASRPVSTDPCSLSIQVFEDSIPERVKSWFGLARKMLTKRKFVSTILTRGGR